MSRVTAALLVVGGKILSGRTKDQNIGYINANRRQIFRDIAIFRECASKRTRGGGPWPVAKACRGGWSKKERCPSEGRGGASMLVGAGWRILLWVLWENILSGRMHRNRSQNWEDFAQIASKQGKFHARSDADPTPSETPQRQSRPEADQGQSGAGSLARNTFTARVFEPNCKR